MTKVILKRGEEDRLLRGHPWIYDNEIQRTEGKFTPGDSVEVYSSAMQFLGSGFINPASKIRVRLFSRNRAVLDRALIEARIREAWNYRVRVAGVDTCRAVFAEADGLPGLVVDRFADARTGKVYLVVQTLALGMDRRRQEIIEALTAVFSPDGIYERNDVPVREREGLEQRKGFIGHEFDTDVVISENGILLHADLSGGQKTGYFLDQRENHAAVEPFSKGARVLDAFCHTGGFALHAAKYGAKDVTAVDISADAAAMVEKNAELNGFGSITVVTANVFDFLREMQEKKQLYDLIVLDPPAFAKSRSTLETARRGYKDINFRALTLLAPGGILVTCSCSHAMDQPTFRAMLEEAASDAGRTVRQVEFRTQSKDHPILYGYDESFYLKCCVLEAR